MFSLYYYELSLLNIMRYSRASLILMTYYRYHHQTNLMPVKGTQDGNPEIIGTADKLQVMGRDVMASQRRGHEGFGSDANEELTSIELISDEQSKQAFDKILVPKIYHPFIEGADRCNLKMLQEKYPGVRISIPPLSVVKDELSIAGEKEGVIAVTDYVNQVWKEMEKKCSHVSAEVKKSQHSYIIGPKGSSINEILAETGVFVEIPANDNPSEMIILRGPQAKLGMALNKVYEKANSVVNESVTCPTWLHKYFVGRKGAGIQKISQDLQKVHIGFNDDNTIKIDGPPDEVEKARVELEKQASELIAGMSFAEIKIDAKYYKHIIGKCWSTINKLKSDFDVTINIPDFDFGVTLIRIEGNKAGVEKAKKELMEMTEKMENEKEKDLIIENRFHRQLIGPKGENIEKIRKDFANAQIGFPDLGMKSDIVKAREPKGNVNERRKNFNSGVHKMEGGGYAGLVVFQSLGEDGR